MLYHYLGIIDILNNNYCGFYSPVPCPFKWAWPINGEVSNYLEAVGIKRVLPFASIKLDSGLLYCANYKMPAKYLKCAQASLINRERNIFSRSGQLHNIT